MIIGKALYGLQTSNVRWAEKIAADLREMGWRQTKYDKSLWIRDAGENYEYLAIYVDDILVFSKRAKEIMERIQQIYPMKGVGEPEMYLGGNIGKIKTTKGNKVHYTSAQKYIENVVEKIETLLDVKLRNYNSPMEAELHPELDESPYLGEKKHSIYRMLIRLAQWAVTLGRFDIAYAVSTMARYTALPKEGHLKAMTRLFGYLKHHAKGKILYDTSKPFYGLAHNPSNYDSIKPQSFITGCMTAGNYCFDGMLNVNREDIPSINDDDVLRTSCFVNLPSTIFPKLPVANNFPSYPSTGKLLLTPVS